MKSWKFYVMTPIVAIATGFAIGCSKDDKDSGGGGNNNNNIVNNNCINGTCAGGTGTANGNNAVFRLADQIGVVSANNNRYESVLEDLLWCTDGWGPSTITGVDCSEFDQTAIVMVDFAETTTAGDGQIPATIYVRPVTDSGQTWDGNFSAVPNSGVYNDLVFLNGTFEPAEDELGNPNSLIKMIGFGPGGDNYEAVIDVTPTDIDNFTGHVNFKLYRNGLLILDGGLDD